MNILMLQFNLNASGKYSVGRGAKNISITSMVLKCKDPRAVVEALKEEVVSK